MTSPEPRGKMLPDGDNFWIRKDGDFRIVTGELSHSCRDCFFGWKGMEPIQGLIDQLPSGGWLPASPPLDERETRDEERQRIAKIKRATCEGCLAAAMGLPLHTVADSGYAARSYCGDAWEAGWEFINGSATWKNHAALTAELAQAKDNAAAMFQAHRAWHALMNSIEAIRELDTFDESTTDHQKLDAYIQAWTKMRERAEAAEAERDRLHRISTAPLDTLEALAEELGVKEGAESKATDCRMIDALNSRMSLRACVAERDRMRESLTTLRDFFSDTQDIRFRNRFKDTIDAALAQAEKPT